MEKQKFVAAIDLGSNSFHMVIAREAEHGTLKIIDRVREMVRLNAGLDENGYLSEASQQKALECLKRFRQRLNTIPYHRIRAVGTNTIRSAHNGDEFLERAQQELSHPISVVSGHEEARLVYLGAAFDLVTSAHRRLVVDIGGGSTELIVGEGYQPLHMDSLELGCVSLTRKVFSNGKYTATKLQSAKNLTLMELEPVINKYKNLNWQEVVGTSGTIKAIDKVSRELGISQDWISNESMQIIENWIIDAKHSKSLSHVSVQRRPVFVAGFIILSTIFQKLGITRMDISQGALREGVAYDLIGRLHNEDSRYQGVNSLADHFNPDLEQAKRVQKLAVALLNQVKGHWHLDQGISDKLLFWAAQLHEIGSAISYSQYHLHGAYIIENSNINGFSRQMQKALALLVQGHRQKFDLEIYSKLPTEWSERIIKLTILLRLSVIFYRSRDDSELSEIELTANGKNIRIRLPNTWYSDHPMTVFDLNIERQILESMGYILDIDSTDRD